MAVPAPPISFVTDVQGEYGANTPAPNNLRAVLEGLFGSGTTKTMLDLEGTNKQLGASLDIPSTIGAEFAEDFNEDITDFGGTDVRASLRIECNTQSDFSGTPIFSSTKTFKSGDLTTALSVNGLTPGQRYYFRTEHWNEYISNSADRLHQLSGLGDNFVTDIDPPTSVSASFNSGDIDISWNHPSHGEPPDGYRIEYRINFGTWTFLDNGVTGTSYTHSNVCSIGSGGDDFQYRVRSEGPFADSTYNNSGQQTIICGP